LDCGLDLDKLRCFLPADSILSNNNNNNNNNNNPGKAIEVKSN